MNKPLRVGVAGAGVFGGYHSSKYASLPGVVFVGVYDLDAERATRLADAHNVRAFSGEALPEFLHELDAVTVATPAFAHASVALPALEAGLHVYTEKPIAQLISDAEKMVDLARDRQRVLATGHQERAVFEAMGLLGVPERPLRLEAVRNGTPSDRNLDVSVVLDLMIHDIDLAIALAGAEAIAFDAVGTRRRDPSFKGEGADQVAVETRFASGMTANLRASRMAVERERTMKIVYPSGEVWVDLLNRKFENTTPFDLNPDFAAAPIARDPLGTSVSRFIGAVNAECEPLCSGEEALQALVVALAIDNEIAGGTGLDAL